MNKPFVNYEFVVRSHGFKPVAEKDKILKPKV